MKRHTADYSTNAGAEHGGQAEGLARTPPALDIELGSANPQRWSAKRKAALVIDILQGGTTAAENARQHALIPAAAGATVAGCVEQDNTRRPRCALNDNTPRQTCLAPCNPLHPQAA